MLNCLCLPKEAWQRAFGGVFPHSAQDAGEELGGTEESARSIATPPLQRPCRRGDKPKGSRVHFVFIATLLVERNFK